MELLRKITRLTKVKKKASNKLILYFNGMIHLNAYNSGDQGAPQQKKMNALVKVKGRNWR